MFYRTVAKTFNQRYFIGSVSQDLERANLNFHRGKLGSTFGVHLENSPAQAESKMASKVEKHHIFRLPHPSDSPDRPPCDCWLFRLLKGIVKDREFHSHDEIEGRFWWRGMASLLKTFRASSPTRRATLHESLVMKESIFLNEKEMPCHSTLSPASGISWLSPSRIAPTAPWFAASWADPRGLPESTLNSKLILPKYQLWPEERKTRKS
jgi:hypothetical protein